MTSFDDAVFAACAHLRKAGRDIGGHYLCIHPDDAESLDVSICRPDVYITGFGDLTVIVDEDVAPTEFRIVAHTV